MHLLVLSPYRISLMHDHGSFKTVFQSITIPLCSFQYGFKFNYGKTHIISWVI